MLLIKLVDLSKHEMEITDSLIKMFQVARQPLEVNTSTAMGVPTLQTFMSTFKTQRKNENIYN